MTRGASIGILMLAATLAAPSASAAVTIQGTRVIHDAARGQYTTVRTSNGGDSPALIQVWIDDGDGSARPEDMHTPFRLTPAEPRLLQPDQGQAYRITYAPRPSDPPLPEDRESLFYFNLLDIPPKPAHADGKNLLQFAVRTRIKLFHRPAGLPGSARDAADSLVWTSINSNTLEVLNPSAYHVTIGRLLLDDRHSVHVDMLAPGQRVTVALPKGIAVPASAAFQWLDDYGTPRDAKATITSRVSGPAR